MTRFLAALGVTTSLLAFVPVPLTAQSQPVPPRLPSVPSPDAAYSDPVKEATALREQFRDVLRRYPRSVGRVLRLDPTLFNDQTYLAGYPALAQFVARYPEIARNPDYYLEGYGVDDYYSTRTPATIATESFKSFLEGLTIFLVIATISAALIWLIRQIIEHRRWLRMTKTQTEVHTKLLDRFSSSEELLAYINTPAGSRFLESAPIAVSAEAPARAVSAPLNRILWSVQAGVVLILAGAGLIFARHSAGVEEVRQMLFMMGTFGIFVGLGFVASALVSYILSTRMGLIGEGTAGPRAPSSTAGYDRKDPTGL